MKKCEIVAKNHYILAFFETKNRNGWIIFNKKNQGINKKGTNGGLAKKNEKLFLSVFFFLLN